MAKAAVHQVPGAAVPGTSNHLMILQLGARYVRPMDDTTVMSVFHRTIDGSVSVLLERDDFTVLAQWLRGEAVDAVTGGPRPGVEHDLHYRERIVRQHVLAFRGTQTKAVLSRPVLAGGMDVRIYWNGSGRTTRVHLDDAQVRELAAWAAERDAQGWAAWRSGTAA